MESRSVSKMMFSLKLLVCIWLTCEASLGAVLAQGKPLQANDSQHALAAARTLASKLDPNSGLFRGTGWWNSANGITALADISRTTQAHEFDPLFESTFADAQRRFPGFLNEFYDDEGWWALAWLDVYQLRGGPRYLAMARAIFADMSGGWSDTCGGGIWWKKNERYKNAIANELFLSVAVQLAAISSGDARAGYLDWATKEERWFLQSGMINGQSLVNDGLDTSCANNGKTTWTYNQGVILAGLVGYNKLTGDAVALKTANRIAEAVRTRLTDPTGVVHDPCEPNCGHDGVQFKGILMRNMVPLLRAAPSPALTTLVIENANSVWNAARTPTGAFSVDWAGPPQDGGTGSLISALDALTAPVTLKSPAPPAAR